MKQSEEILNELKEISPLVASIGNENIYQLPDGYFEALSKVIFIKAQHADKVVVNNNVPDGYFEKLPATVLSKINGTAVNELEALSAALAAINKDTPFTVPKNYFENTPQQILAKAKVAKVVAMPVKRSIKIWQYAAAAIFAAAVLVGVYKYLPNTVNPSTELTTLDPAIEQGKKIDVATIDKNIDELDANDIVAYLQANESETDLAALTSEISEINLPSQEDYLTDETTLDNFIKSINTKN